MTNFLERLRTRLKFLNSKWFNWIVGMIILLNPIAILPQLIKAITAPSVEGLSISMFLLFALIQFAFVAVGIQKLDWRMVLGMGISFLQTITIIVIIIIR